MRFKGFYESPGVRDRGQLGRAQTTKLKSANAFGLKLVQRDAFMQNPRVPRVVKRNLGEGAWVLYLPKAERSALFVHDDPTTCLNLALAHMQEVTK
jgi:hypothetical protein